MIGENTNKESVAGKQELLYQKSKILGAVNTRYTSVEAQLRQLGEMITVEPDWVDLLMSLLPVGVSICTDLSYQEVRHNPVAADFLRLSQRNICQAEEKPTLKILHEGKIVLPEDMPIRRCIRFGEHIENLEMEYIWEDDVRKIFLYNAWPLHNTVGVVIGAIAIFQYLGEKICAENEMVASRILRTMAHELRNPMAGIRGISSLIKLRLDSGKPLANLPRMLEDEIDRLSSRMDQIIEEAFICSRGGALY